MGNVGQVRRDRAVYLALRNGRLQGTDRTADRGWLCQFGVSAVGQSLRRARAHAEGVRRLGAGSHHRRQLSGGGPWGQYDDSKLVNIGTNRWSFKPEVGISKAIGPWTMEFEAAATFYTDNNDFFGGKTLSQAPMYSLQGHLIYGFRSGIWASLDATYFVGGRTTVNGVLNSDLQQNWRVGGTLAFPVNRENSIKLYASSGVAARTGDSYDLIGVAWQYRWGGGL